MALIAEREPGIAEGQPGFYLSFSLPRDEMDSADLVADGTRKVELVAVRAPHEDEPYVQATVFVPERAAEYFTGKVEAYRDEDRALYKDGRPTGPKNENLVSRVVDVEIGTVRDLFTDDPATFPMVGEAIWWEVWVREGRADLVSLVANKLNIARRQHTIRFPEREVMLLYGNEAQLDRLVRNIDAVAELRRATDTPAMFVEMASFDQGEWVDDLQDRLEPPAPDAPFVTVLDSGATQGHPLLTIGLEAIDQHTVEPNWGVADTGWNGHGTAMCGGVLYPNLEEVLQATESVPLTHRLETVKVLPHDGDTNNPRLYGAITTDAVELVEGASPARRRIFCMAISSRFQTARGRPSSWSAAVDNLCFGEGGDSRLFVVTTGNIRDTNIMGAGYPDRNDIEQVESPGQAWNALVVGGYTVRNTLTDPTFAGWEPVAPVGALAPVSRTSITWENQWPVRPDVVFEAGNLAHDGENPAEPVNDLQLVTTHYRPQYRLLESFGDTSAAAAQAASLCAQIRAAYPSFWPETVRGLIIHAAEWTPHMRAALDGAGTQRQTVMLMRRFGWGVPEVARAVRCAANDATVIIQDSLIPFTKNGSTAKLSNLNFHRLPWPKDQLSLLGNSEVELRATLSYFIEPNPAERGWTRRHRYASHGLRFRLKQPLETDDQFRARINKAADVDDDVGESPDDGDGWVLGQRARDRGSVHSDFWRGPAVELSDRDLMAVLPVSGWWKEKPGLGRCDQSVRYSLVLSIKAEETEVDIHAAIATELAVAIPVG